MTPKQKAIGLMGKFYHSSFGESWNPFVKSCALACVDEIIQHIRERDYEYVNNIYCEGFLFWKEVQEEIKKL